MPLRIPASHTAAPEFEYQLCFQCTSLLMPTLGGSNNGWILGPYNSHRKTRWSSGLLNLVWPRLGCCKQAEWTSRSNYSALWHCGFSYYLHTIWVPVPVLAALLPIQLPGKASGKPATNDSSFWAPAVHVGSPDWVLGSWVQPGPKCISGWKMFLSLSVTLSFK